MSTYPLLLWCEDCKGWGRPFGCDTCGAELRWYYPGDIESHLRDDHKVNLDALHGWDRVRLELFHDWLHNKEIGMSRFKD